MLAHTLPVRFDEKVEFHLVLFLVFHRTGNIATNITAFQWEINA